MSTTKHSIVPISSKDLPTIASFIYTSKLSLLINRVLYKDWPNEAAEKPNYTSAVKLFFEDPSREMFKVVDDEHGEIIGHLVLSKKAAGDEKDIGGDGKGDKRGDKEIPKHFNPEVYKALTEAMKELEKDWQEIDHYELTHIYVAPAHRNKGIGSQLVKLCIAKAKAEDLPLALCSEPQLRSFLLKLGFGDTKHVEFDLSQWTPDYSGFGAFRLWGMVLKDSGY